MVNDLIFREVFSYDIVKIRFCKFHNYEAIQSAVLLISFKKVFFCVEDVWVVQFVHPLELLLETWKALRVLQVKALDSIMLLGSLVYAFIYCVAGAIVDGFLWV